MQNVIKMIAGSDDGLPHPSQLPSYRSVTWIKGKEKKKKESASVDICHKMAEEQDSFIKCHHVSGNEVSVVLFNKEQLDDIEKFCCNDSYPCSALGIDTTFQFGNFYVVTTSYRHPFLQSREGTYPTLLGPMMVTHQLQRHNYRLLFDTMTQDAPELTQNLKAFMSNGEDALQQAASEVFPCALSLMCLTHIERDIKRKIRIDLGLSLPFYNAVMNDLSGDTTNKGLIHTETFDEYHSTLRKLQTKWNMLEKLEEEHKDPQFYDYFIKDKAQIIYDHCRVKLSQDLNLISQISDNNAPEFMHAAMKFWQSEERKDIPAFIEDMRDLVKTQLIEVKYAFISNPGPYSLRREYQDKAVQRETLSGEGTQAEVSIDTNKETVGPVESNDTVTTTPEDLLEQLLGQTERP